ncbi:MAG: AraC family transcriptional regulator [Sphingomonas fennica]
MAATGVASDQPMVRRFSTTAVNPAARLDYWNRLASESSAGLSIDSPNRAFTGAMERWQVGDLTMMRVRAEASAVNRAPLSGGAERLRVHLQLRGTCRQSHLGREAILRAGDFSICTSASPAVLEATDHEMLILDVERQALARRAAGIDLWLGCPTGATSPAAHSFAEFALAIWREARRLDGAGPSAWQQECADILLDLLGLAIRSTVRAGRPTALPAIERMRAIVEARLAEPDLSAAFIAAEMGVSVRTVQLGFAGEGTTPGEYIRTCRLERARQRLAGEDAPITEIAFDLGFNDSSYFTRCFRQAHGIGPREWRAAARRRPLD